MAEPSAIEVLLGGHETQRNHPIPRFLYPSEADRCWLCGRVVRADDPVGACGGCLAWLRGDTDVQPRPHRWNYSVGWGRRDSW